MNVIAGWTEIARAFGATISMVKGWAKSGAPILLFGKNPVTRGDDLWEWLLANRDRAGDRIHEVGMSAARAKKLIPEDGKLALVAAALGKG